MAEPLKHYAVPESRAERDRVHEAVRAFTSARALVPPLSMGELQRDAGALVQSAGIPAAYRDFALVLLNNEVWRDSFAAVPYNRRTLILPPCLRAKDKCTAATDELGLVCARCGACAIAALQDEAERLGYAVLVVEGTSIVTSIIRAGGIDAVVGVSCMESLEAAFPHMAANAIPGVAIPLLRNGCENTQVDVEWVRAAIRFHTPAAQRRRLDSEALRACVDGWFQPESIAALLGTNGSVTERLALGWLGKAGKRWRPYLTACVCEALRGADGTAPPAGLRAIALAVECFHKASLVHDDIEDNDDLRYGEKTLHRCHGVPLALNTGDFLIGEGYRLIAHSDAGHEQRAAMLAIAAEGHRALCVGQGEELAWTRSPRVLTAGDVLALFRLKTAPAFEVALRLGAVYGGGDASLHAALTEYSTALGIGYQINDDLDDFLGTGNGDDLAGRRPSLLAALACDAAGDAAAAVFTALWRCDGRCSDVLANARRIIASSGADTRARALLDEYREHALAALGNVRVPELKMLLARVLHRILGE